MSAYICDVGHLKGLAIYAALPGKYGSNRVRPQYFGVEDGVLRERIASAYANILYDENVRSVRYRYPDDKWDELPGPVKKPLRIVVTKADMARFRDPGPVQVLKACDCLEYQSCETEDYRDSNAFKLLTAIRGAAITYLSGYDQAEWGWTDAA